MATATLNVTNSNVITVTIASLATGSTNTSSAVDNSTTKYLEAVVQVKIKTNAAGTSATGYCNIWLVRSADGGTTYDDTSRNLLGTLPTVANATTYIGSWSTAPYGAIGTSWKITVENQSGAALDSTAGSHLAQYAGVTYSIT